MIAHTWKEGATLPGAREGVPVALKLATCTTCGCLRASEEGEKTRPPRYVRRRAGVDRVVHEEPECVPSSGHFRAPW